MSYQFNDELISAYVDGELTAEEQALVERKLRESPEHQQMLNELSALHDSFQSLPSHKLDEGFGQRVLRAAERKMLTGGDNSGTAFTSSAPVADSPTPAGKIPEDRQNWRLAVGSVAAVAALLLITLFLVNFSNKEDGHRNVASRDLKERQGSGVDRSDRTVRENQPGVLPGQGDNRDLLQQAASPDASAEGAKSRNGGDSAVPRVGEDLLAKTKKAAQPKPSRFVGKPSKGRPPVKEVQENKSFSAPAEMPAPLNESQVASRRANRVPSDKFANGGKRNYALGAEKGGFDFVVFVDVPQDQIAARPVEQALRRRNVADELGQPRLRNEIGRGAAESPRTELSARTPAAQARSRVAKKPLEDEAADSYRLSDSAPLSDELLVVATLGQIEEVCADLRGKGLAATPVGWELSASDAEPRPGMKQVQGAESLKDSANNDGIEKKTGQLSELFQENQRQSDRKHSFGSSRATEGNNGSANSVAQQKPATAAPVAASREKSAGEVEPASRAGAPADAREASKLRRAQKSQKVKVGDKLERDAVVSKTSEADRIKAKEKANEKRASNKSESRRLDEANPSYFRRVGRGEPFFGREQSAAKSAAKSAAQSGAKSDASRSGAAPQRQSDVNGTRPLSILPSADAVTNSNAFDVTPKNIGSATRVQVRFIIRAVESPPASGSTAEQSESK